MGPWKTAGATVLALAALAALLLFLWIVGVALTLNFVLLNLDSVAGLRGAGRGPRMAFTSAQARAWDVAEERKEVAEKKKKTNGERAEMMMRLLLERVERAERELEGQRERERVRERESS